MTRLDDATASPEMRLRVGDAPWELVQDDIDRRLGQWRVLDAHDRLVLTGSVEQASLAVYAVNELGTRTTAAKAADEDHATTSRSEAEKPLLTDIRLRLVEGTSHPFSVTLTATECSSLINLMDHWMRYPQW